MLVVVEDIFACRCKCLWFELGPVTVIDNAEYGNNCGMWPQPSCTGSSDDIQMPSCR